MKIIKDEILTANKEHRCSFCGAPITKGERYKKITFDDGGIDVSKYHLRCNAAIEKYNEGDEVDMVQVMDSVNKEITANGITPSYYIHNAIIQWYDLQNKHMPNLTTRKGQIENAALEAYPYEGGTKGYICENARPIFIQGAEWADKSLINKAVNWLQSEMERRFNEESGNYEMAIFTGSESGKEWLDEFRKVMNE